METMDEMEREFLNAEKDREEAKKTEGTGYSERTKRRAQR